MLFDTTKQASRLQFNFTFYERFKFFINMRFVGQGSAGQSKTDQIKMQRG